MENMRPSLDELIKQAEAQKDEKDNATSKKTEDPNALVIEKGR